MTALFPFVYRHVSGELALEYADLMAAKESVDHLVALVEEIVPYDMQHNAEAEACDLLMELERIASVISYVDESTYPRVCLYLFRYVLEAWHPLSVLVMC